MAQHVEPMDVDCLDSEFENKENSYHHNNVLPCTEKGYEELDVSELNMKLRYSITPASSPMSKSYTTYVDRNLESDDLLNTNENANLTRSLNSTMTKNDSVIKSLKTLPLQTISTEQVVDNRSSVLRQLDSTITDVDNNVTVTISGATDIDENLSLPSSSSSAIHTPEATTPTNITKNDEGSPIIRGLKSVLNMFRSSQSPIPPVENDNTIKPEVRSLDITCCEDQTPQTLASTPISAHRSRDGSTSKRSSPLKDSIVFSDDLEKELQWKDDTVLFSDEKIPIHKLFLPHSKPTPIVLSATPQKEVSGVENLNLTVEYMDVSYNNSVVLDNTLTETHNNINAVDSDGEFVDCETTFSKNESQNVESKVDIHKNTLETLDVTKEYRVTENVEKIENANGKDLKEISKTLNTTTDITEDNPAVKENVLYGVNKSLASTDADKKLVKTKDTINDSTSNEIVLCNNDMQIEHTTEASNAIAIVVENIENAYEKEPEEVSKLLDKTTDVTENMPAVNENVKQKNESIPSIDADKSLNETKDCIENNSTLNESVALDIQNELINDASNALQITDDVQFKIISENLENSEPSADIPKNNNESIDNVNISTPLKSNEMYNDVDEKPLKETKNDTLYNLPDLENDEKFKNLKKETVNIESENVSIENYVEIPFEGYKESTNLVTDNDMTQFIRNTKNVYAKTNIDLMENFETNITSDIIAYQNPDIDMKEVKANLDSESKNIKQNLEKPIAGDEVDKPEKIPEIEVKTQILNDITDIKELRKEVNQPDTHDLPADIPLPNDNDFDIDLKPNNDVAEPITPDELDSIKTEPKLDAIQSLNGTLDVEVLSLEKLDVFNETRDIVNSLTEIIGESANVTASECMLDQSRSDIPMEGIECVNETQVLPDLVNQAIHNMIVQTDIISKLNHQTQSDVNSENIEDIYKPNLSDTTPNLNEEIRSIPDNLDTLIDNSSQHSNDSLNLDKEHTIAISAPMENIEVVLEKKSPEAPINNENVDNKLKEIADLNNILESEVKTINEVPVIDEELVLSGNNSPYVSVIADTVTQLKPAEESFEKVEIPLNTTAAPPSPPIRSRGYNFNFDEMDDPFATKTKIRESPPPTSNKLEDDNEDKTESKKVVPKRRQSQPPARKRPTLNKKKFNTTFDAGNVNNCPSNRSGQVNYDGDSKNVSINIIKNSTVTMDISDAADKEVEKIIDSTQILENMPEENIEKKSSTESITTISTSEIKTSSSEQSTYYSAAGSSSDSSISKNVFNLPEIDDKNFNPFATKSKMRQSPPPNVEIENPFATKSKMRISSESLIIGLPNVENPQSMQNCELEPVDKVYTEQMEKDNSYNVGNITSSSENDKNVTELEVHMEDEDTEEGPFIEAEDANDKFLDIDNDNMMQFDEVPPQAGDENIDGGELFIDAEAFEFLLNQNKSNVVADSGKESLFLKFDPLFSKRISSDGVLAALNQVQKRQSTPTKPTRPSLRNEASPIAGPSKLNVTYEDEINTTQDSVEDLNVTVAKPTLAVTPAVNSAVTPRNKTATPPRSTRHSITFTSPAMAVIDRLLSLSGNNSLLGHDTTMTHANREHTEADVALTQLRELLAEKEISVYQLRSESIELKDRLTTMETQVKILEAHGEERLKKINELNNRVAEKAKINKSMATVVEEYEKTIARLIAESEQDKKRHAEERIRLINERDEQTAHLASMEVSFSDLHSKYEKSKQMILSCKANEETCKKSIKDFEENLMKMQTNYEMLKQHATSKLNHANQELQKINKSHESEVLKLNALIKRKDMHITSLEETLAQKTKANEELTAICDELINKVG